MPTVKRQTLRLKNHIDELNRLNKFVQGFIQKYSLDERTGNMMNLVLEEIFANIVRYAFQNGQQHEIRIDLVFKAKTLAVSVEDDGIPFNPLEQPEPDIRIPLKERAIGGLGIHLIKSLVDRISYERTHDRNRLTLEATVIRQKKKGGEHADTRGD